MKGLIPAAGMGKRLEPITHAIPKELLMVGDKAIIEYVIDSMKQVGIKEEYVIDSMKQVGIKEICVVVGWRKHAILDYLGSGERLGVNISYVVQDKRDGLGKAVLAGKHIIGDDIFLVVLGDNFFHPKTFLKEILEFHLKNHADATVGVAKIEDPTRHGIIKPGGDNNIIDFIEKPS